MNENEKQVTRLPDGSGFFIASLPLPADHWLYAKGENEPPMPLRMGASDPERIALEAAVTLAVRYALRAATMNGTTDYDPDAVVQNTIVGLCGYYTEDGRSGSRIVRRR